jgi:D-glycero-beta-D-manno-heptose-7-phosphate kinase
MMSLNTVIDNFSTKTLIVVGDVILDEYLIGTAERMSREAPIPVLELTERRHIAGGAANPSANLAVLGAKVFQAGIIGQDYTGDELLRILEGKGIFTETLIRSVDRPTTLKTRIMAQMGLRFPQQLARIDTLSREPIDNSLQAQLFKAMFPLMPQTHALLFSDYHNGLLVPSLIQNLLSLSAPYRVLLTADAQGNLDKYQGCHLIKCNAQDAQNYIGQKLTEHDDFAQVALQLCQNLNAEAFVITRGAEGATLATKEGETFHCPAPKVSDVYDTVGAGDTSIAVMTLARLGGASWFDSVLLANIASGIVVQHVGNYTPTRHELKEALLRFQLA